MEKCGHLLRCWDYSFRPCVRPKGHNDDGNVNAHNPFSNTVPPKIEHVLMRKPPQSVRQDELVSA